MAYATFSDAQLLYGTAYPTIVCDRDGDGSVDALSFTQQLAVASDEIDGLLLGYVDLPLPFVPAIFKKLCCDIAIYNSAPTADVRTTEMKERRDAAIELVKDIRKNLRKLPQTSDGATPAPNQPATPDTITRREMSPQLEANHARTFTRGKMRGLL